jgi:uncharacterized protein YegL
LLPKKPQGKEFILSRRLPVYLLIDTSGSMNGESILSVNVGLQAMLQALRQDPHALDTVHLSLITFDADVKEIFPLTALEEVQIPEITCPRSGPTHMGAALDMLVHRVERDVRHGSDEQKSDWRALLFLMTDGAPSDIQLYHQMLPKVKSVGFSRIVACAAGPKAKEDQLKKLTDTVVSLDTTDSTAFAAFFKWVSGSVTAGSASAGLTSGQDALPPPPDELQVVV